MYILGDRRSSEMLRSVDLSLPTFRYPLRWNRSIFFRNLSNESTIYIA